MKYKIKNVKIYEVITTRIEKSLNSLISSLSHTHTDTLSLSHSLSLSLSLLPSDSRNCGWRSHGEFKANSWRILGEFLANSWRIQEFRVPRILVRSPHNHYGVGPERSISFCAAFSPHRTLSACNTIDAHACGDL